MNGARERWNGSKMMLDLQLSFLANVLKGKVSYLCKSESLNGTLMILNNTMICLQ